MTSASALAVGSGRSTDVPSEARAASGGTDTAILVSYRHEEFSGIFYRPVPVPPEVRADHRLLLALGYSDQASEAAAFAEESMTAQGEAIQELD